MNPGEIESLVALVASVEPKRVIEIGVNDGLTAKAILDHVPTISDYLGVDVLPGYRFEKPLQQRELPKNPGYLAAGNRVFRLYIGLHGSRDLAPGHSQIPHDGVDVVFIDGDHGRAAVEYDSSLARAIIRPGGIIVWHDYVADRGVDVHPVLDEQFNAGRKLFRVENTWLAFERF